MTPRERFLATVNHERPDHLLYYTSFVPELQKRVIVSQRISDEAVSPHFGFFSWNGTALKRPEDYPVPDYSHYFDDVPQPPGSAIDGNGCLHVPGSEHHFTHRVSPLRHASSSSDFDSYPWTDWTRYDSSHFAQHAIEARANGLIASVSCTHMYEEAWQVRGYEEFLVDMLTEPDWAHRVLDYFKHRNIRTAIDAAEAGVDVLRTGDDVANQTAMMFSMDVWREFIRDKWAEVYSAAKRIKPDIKIWYHSDGNITDIIPELIDIGVDIFNPMQPECIDVVEIKKRYGDRIVMDGAIGTQTTMPFGTPGEVRACVKERIETLGGDGALILSPTHVLEPEVPIENILAFVDACREFG